MDEQTPSESSKEASQELVEWCARYRVALRAMVQLRIHPDLRARVDPSDVVQEVFLVAAKRYAEYAAQRRHTPYVWLRMLAKQQLAIEYRRHIETDMRSVNREVGFQDLSVSSVAWAELFVDQSKSASSVVRRGERLAALASALDSPSPDDREIVTLRHLERLNLREVSEAMGISHDAARQRYVRSMERLVGLLQSFGFKGSESH